MVVISNEQQSFKDIHKFLKEFFLLILLTMPLLLRWVTFYTWNMRDPKNSIHCREYVEIDITEIVNIS